ncbi:MAG TPA: SusC/RagA family TonB-linked outer membrane protein [Paludibacter sp.]|nr:MAG: TonB dependent receptor [Bacteroidetes bacterium ADurb.Bin174]HQB27869.1 SusC/RagA family TonB-linked outer membrane protein [Paludibacter sp.]
MNIRRNKTIKLIPLFLALFCYSLNGQTIENSLPGFSRPDGGFTTIEEMVGANELIDGDQLVSYPDALLSNSLQGKLGGLIVRMTNNGLSNNEANLLVRGQNTKGNNAAIVIVDGIVRPFNDLLPEEIESVEVLKDAPAKILYGPDAANGVVVIKTKRGALGDKKMSVGVESGVMHATRLPKFLDSYDYALLYNEARENDGLPALYLPYQLTGYQNSTGPNDVLYPNVDWYDYFLKNQSLFRKATLSLKGGSRALKYSLVAGYKGVGGLEKIGEPVGMNRLNLRGNIDIEITSYMSVVADVAGRVEERAFSAVNNANVFTALSTNRPNEYPLIIDPDIIGLTPDEDGIPFFGSSINSAANLLADFQYRGFTQERYITSQNNLGLEFDFNKQIKGLAASAYVTFDNYTQVTQQLRRDYPTYAVRTYLDELGAEQAEFTLMKKLDPNDNISATSPSTYRTIGWYANLSYARHFDLHHLSAIAGYRYFKGESQGVTQDDINLNYNMRVNYGYDSKYLAEINLVNYGSNKFVANNRNFLSYAVGAGWIMSKEDFLQDVETINFLKLKASYGLLGFSGNNGYLLANSRWQDGGIINTNEGNTSNAKVVNLVRIGNPDLEWEKSRELNFGLEGALFNNRLQFGIDYFNNLRSDIITTEYSAYGDYIGPFTMPTNVGSVKNQGIDGNVSWGDKSGDLTYRIGVNFTASKNKLLSWDENPNIPEEARKSVGKPTDAIFGLQSRGLFGRDVDITTAPVQGFGPYRVGDLAYVDANNDGYVDNRDHVMIGNSFPYTVLGIDLDLKYKNWGLYVLGTSELGVHHMLNNSYFWNTGDSKYSVIAEQRYHPVNNPSGIYPALTTKNGENSYRASDFWLEDASFFRLKNIELSYLYNFKDPSFFIKDMKIFARGTNVFVLSKQKDLDPEVLGAGLTNYPVTAYYTGGVTFTF